jgi:deferrochelatase/peroxidase EfeB
MAQQKPHDVNEPSRRRLLKGIGALGGALAITGGCPVAHAAKAESSRDAVTGRAPGKQPFYGPSGGHSDAAAGVDDAGGLRCAGADKADLERLFRLLTQRIAF